MSWSSRKKQEEIFCSLFCLCMDVHPCSYFCGMDISEVPGHHLLQQTSAIISPPSQKLLHRLVSHELTAYLSILNLF